MRILSEKQSIALLLTLFLALSLFSPGYVEAAKTKTAYVDIQSGVLNVRSGPGMKYKIIGTVKKSAKLTIYSETKSGWAETRVNKKKGYVSKEFLRFYKKMSNAEAKKITDKAVEDQEEIFRHGSALKNLFSKKHAYKKMKPSFTNAYIDKFLKYDTFPVDKNKEGETLYKMHPSSQTKYKISNFNWEGFGDIVPQVPTVKHYIKNGKQYLYIRQKYFTAEYGTFERKLYFSRTSSKTNWKVYNFSIKFYNKS